MLVDFDGIKISFGFNRIGPIFRDFESKVFLIKDILLYIFLIISKFQIK